MKIIKDGHEPDVKPKPVRFTCDYCGCVFDADETEYNYVGTKVLMWHKTYVCGCPCCGRAVTKHINGNALEE